MPTPQDLARHGVRRAPLEQALAIFSGRGLSLFGHAGALIFGMAVLILWSVGIIRQDDIVSVLSVMVLLFLATLLGVRVTQRYRQDLISPRWLGDAELGILLLAAIVILAEAGGGRRSALYAIVYLFIASYATIVELGVALALALLLSLAELGAHFYSLEEASLWQTGVRVLLPPAFATLSNLLLHAEVLRRRLQFKRRLSDHLRRLADDARLFRLTSVLGQPEEHLDLAAMNERQLAASVGAVRDGIHNLFEMSQSAFHPPLHSLLLFLLDHGQFTIKEATTKSALLCETPIPMGQGALGAVVTSKKPLLLHDLSSRYKGIPYYREPEDIYSLAVVPFLRDGDLCGLLVADRTEKAPFSEEEVSFLTTLCREVGRVMEFESLFIDLFKQRRAYEKFHKAARDFNRATSVQLVAEAAIRSARDVCGGEFAAVTVHDRASDRGTIVSAAWEGHEVEHLLGRKLWPDAGLVSMVVKHKHALPEPATLNPRQYLFDAATVLKELKAAKIFPLLWNEEVVGTLAVGSHRVGFLSAQARSMVEVIADHTAIALANAQLYERLETLATTDGLTGLVNHRHFQEELQESFLRAVRYQRTLSLLIGDIDHFKRVNDTYGHPIGDQVLKQVAECLATTARRTDIIARYGGEEFAIIMEETDWAGALRIGERIRERVSRIVQQSPQGTFQCTLSLGVATYPEHAKGRAELVTCADKALYEAKRAGRDRVIVYGRK